MKKMRSPSEPWSGSRRGSQFPACLMNEVMRSDSGLPALEDQICGCDNRRTTAQMRVNADGVMSRKYGKVHESI